MHPIDRGGRKRRDRKSGHLFRGSYISPSSFADVLAIRDYTLHICATSRRRRCPLPLSRSVMLHVTAADTACSPGKMPSWTCCRAMRPSAFALSLPCLCSNGAARHPVAFAWRIALCSQFQRPQSDGPSGARRQQSQSSTIALEAKRSWAFARRRRRRRRCLVRTKRRRRRRPTLPALLLLPPVGFRCCLAGNIRRLEKPTTTCDTGSPGLRFVFFSLLRTAQRICLLAELTKRKARSVGPRLCHVAGGREGRRRDNTCAQLS